MLDAVQFLAQGIYVENATDASRLLGFIQQLHAIKTQHPLIRIGTDADGGILVPDDLSGIQACFTSAISHDLHFEQDLLRRYGIPSHLADHSPKVLPPSFQPVSFIQKSLGSLNDEKSITLDAWFERTGVEATQSEYMLQMDLEGGELEVMLNASEDLLRRFRIIVIEVHSIYAWANPHSFGVTQAAFQRLLQFFYVVHIHPNNNDGLIDIGGILSPRTLELTLFRKDRAHLLGHCTEFPNTLDRPNSPAMDEVPLPVSWYRSVPSAATRLLLCRPQGGFNDILCSIEYCWTYAERYGRQLAIDTRQSGIQDDWWKYFEPIRPNGLSFNLDYESFDAMSTRPHAIKGKVSRLKVAYSSAKGGMVDEDTNELLTFDVQQDHPEPLLVHEQGWLGGYLLSPATLSRLKLSASALRDIKARLSQLPTEFVSIHIRHTDYTTDYAGLLMSIADEVTGKNVLICSDNFQVIEFTKASLPHANVFRLSKFGDNRGQMLHYAQRGDRQYSANIEMLVDLFALVLSKKLYFGNVNEAGRPSGFSLLANELRRHPVLVNRLLDLS